MSRPNPFAVLLFLSWILILAACTGGPAVTPPEPVKAALEQRFSDATGVKWDSDDSGFRAVFTRGGHATTAFFLADGTWMKTETSLLPSELPSVVVQTLFGAYPGKSVDMAARVDSAGVETFYRLAIKRKGNTDVILLSSGGVILQNPEIKPIR